MPAAFAARARWRLWIPRVGSSRSFFNSCLKLKISVGGNHALPPRPREFASPAIKARRCLLFNKGSVPDNFLLRNATPATMPVTLGPLSNGAPLLHYRPLTTCSSTAEVLGVLFTFPPYTAVMAWLPVASEAVENLG
jgi:hypothetical protein